MSLYQTQKFLYQLNREPRMQTEFRETPGEMLDQYELNEEERMSQSSEFRRIE